MLHIEMSIIMIIVAWLKVAGLPKPETYKFKIQASYPLCLPTLDRRKVPCSIVRCHGNGVSDKWEGCRNYNISCCVYSIIDKSEIAYLLFSLLQSSFQFIHVNIRVATFLFEYPGHLGLGYVRMGVSSCYAS